MVKKGDKFRINWDRLIAENMKYGDNVTYQKEQRFKYKDTIFTAAKVHKGVGVSGYIITYELPDVNGVFGGIGECFAIKVKTTKE
jgi:hypothetical protein